MIIGLFGNEVIGQLAASNFRFNLTGSRFFGTANERSDWDFYAQYSEEVSAWLAESGFRKLDSYYVNGIGFDINTVEIWRKYGVDVQLCKNADVKRCAAGIIKELGISLDKKAKNPAEIRHVWDTLAIWLSKRE